MKGAYILVLYLPHHGHVGIGRLNDIFFKRGFYAYVGSAMGGLEARLKRHLQKRKKTHWHIDYFLRAAEIIDVVIIETNIRIECSVASFLGKSYPAIRKFGATDCKCNGHLFYLGKKRDSFNNLIEKGMLKISGLQGLQDRKRASKIRGVLFDLDGTLTLPGAIDFPAIKREMGCPIGVPILEYIESQPEGQKERLWTILERHEQRAAEISLPNVNAEQCLKALKARGVRLGIITRNSASSVKKVLSKFQQVKEDTFEAIITREMALPKPHPQGVEMAAKKMRITPLEMLVVGDYRFDIIAGKVVGAKTALLKSPISVSDPDFDPIADYRISKLMELVMLVA